MKQVTSRSQKTYRLILWGLLTLSLVALAFLAPKLTAPQNLSTDDFFPFWAAAKLNHAGQNPYDPQNKENLQIAVSGHGSTTYPIAIMLNPPWTVSLVMPFGLVSYPISRLAWLIVSIACIVYSAQQFWQLFNGPARKRWMAWVAVLLFTPVISVLEVGQSSALILLGITLFMHFTQHHKNDWAAGASLVLVAIKPQVLLIFWLAILFWIIQQRRWIVLLSSVMTAVGLVLIAMLFNPPILSQYLTMVRTGYLSELATPTLGAYLRYFWLGVDKFWLQFVPTLLASAWFIWYWRKHGQSWSWIHELPIMLLVSQVSAPYTYTYDQIILLPVVIQAAVWLLNDWKRWMTILLYIVFVTINILDLVLHIKLSDFWFVWMAPSIFIWYLIIRWQYQHPKLENTVPVPI